MEFVADSTCVDRLSVAVKYGERIDVDGPDILLLHYTGMESAEGALKWLCAEESGVSCHYFVFEDGEIVQLLPESVRAHHAGVSYWQGHTDINSRSIGIEIANPGHLHDPLPEFPDVQMAAVARLCKDIIDRNSIDAHLVLAHSDVAPNRKSDPGENFDWKGLAQQGIGHFVEPAAMSSGRYFQRGDEGEPVEALQSMLALYGYDVPVNGTFDEKTYFSVLAFQRHFRPEKTDGVADASTIQTLHDLLKALPSAQT